MDVRKLRDKIVSKKAKIGVIGLGYVGLPLAITFTKKGFKVFGIDINKNRIRRVKRGQSYILDVSSQQLKEAIWKKRLEVTDDFSIIRKLDAVIICVPTPLKEKKEPDVSYIISAVENIKRFIQKGQIVVLESTTYPGTTEEIILPMLESTGLKEGKDFFLVFSPERIDPSNPKFKTENTPKVIGGISPKSTRMAKLLYSQVINRVVSASSTKVAETAKLLENTFRIVNIGLVNEIMLMCDKLGIDVWEVIDVAKTKPYGYMPFYPGPGVGGHCLSKDEYVFVKDETGLKTTRISKLASGLLKDPNSKIYRINGIEFIRPRGLEVLSYDLDKNRACFQRVRLLSTRTYSGKIIRIRTDGGRMFAITDRHPMLVWKDGGLKVKLANELDIGDELPLILGLPSLNKKQHYRIDLIDFLKSRKITDGVRVKPCNFKWTAYRKEIADIGRKRHLYYWDYFKCNSIPLNIFLELEKNRDLRLDRKRLLLCTGRGPSCQDVPAIISLDEELCRFIGYYLSQGCITKDKSIRIRLTFNRDEKEYIDDIKSILHRLGIKYSIYQSKNWLSTCIKISSALYGYLLRDILKCGVNSYSMKIPERIFLLSRKHRLNLLMGLLRGDAGIDYVNKRKIYTKNNKRYYHNFNSANVNYFSASSILFNQVVLLLQDFGFVPNFKNNRKNYLSIFGYEQLRKIKSLFMGEKEEKLSKYLNNNRKKIHNKTFTLHGNLATTKIKQISHSKTDKVYSMEVLDTNTFISSYGILTHNCIPVDPIYLSWKARGYGFEARFIEIASYINSRMPHYVVERITRALNEHRKPLKGSKVLIVGVAYKKDVKDLRGSPALEIINLLQNEKAQVCYYDPYLPYLKIDKIDLKSLKFNRASFRDKDCVVIVTDHSNVDYEFILKHSALIVDTRNVFRNIKGRKDKVIKL